MRIALANNPDLLASTRFATAAGYDVRVARASRLPTLSGVVSGTYVNDLGGGNGGFPTAGTQTSAGLNARIPLFQGGLPAARTRQAQALEGQLLEQVIGTVLCSDTLIHTWDLARATGQYDTLDPQAIEEARAFLAPNDELLRGPGAFGPKIAPPPDADLQTEFLCFVGRQP